MRERVTKLVFSFQVVYTLAKGDASLQVAAELKLLGFKDVDGPSSQRATVLQRRYQRNHDDIKDNATISKKTGQHQRQHDLQYQRQPADDIKDNQLTISKTTQ